MNNGDRTGLRLSGVTVRLGDGDAMVTALDDVDLTVAPGELSPWSAPPARASRACSRSPAR
jgi:putative ABC transport system ATP-binding protein